MSVEVCPEGAGEEKKHSENLFQSHIICNILFKVSLPSTNWSRRNTDLQKKNRKVA